MARKKKSPSTGPSSGSRVCRFEFQHSEAIEVYIAGSFNDWHPCATPMDAVGRGRWVKELTLPPGRHEYRFVVNGEWVDDPNAKEIVPNPHGGANAVLNVPST